MQENEKDGVAHPLTLPPGSFGEQSPDVIPNVLVFLTASVTSRVPLDLLTGVSPGLKKKNRLNYRSILSANQPRRGADL